MPAVTIAAVRTHCPSMTSSSPSACSQPCEKRACQAGNQMLVTSVSSMATACAAVYATPLVNSRKVEIVAFGRLYRACVQNSRKWKSDSAEVKRAGRQSGLGCSSSRYAASRAEAPRETPRLKDRIAMPLCDRFWPGSRSLYGIRGTLDVGTSVVERRRTSSSRRGVQMPDCSGRPAGQEIEALLEISSLGLGVPVLDVPVVEVPVLGVASLAIMMFRITDRMLSGYLLGIKSGGAPQS